MAESSGQMSCWPEFTSINLDIDHMESELTFPYFSKNVEGLYLTDVKGVVKPVGEKLLLTAEYKEGWGLPFVVYAVMIFRGNELLAFEDFTNGCRSPGISMFPGDHEELIRIKVGGEPTKDLKVIVWAR